MSLKCKQHKYNECEFIYLRQNAKNILICSSCVDESNGSIRMNDCVVIKQLLQSDIHTVLPKYPPLNNPTLNQLIFHLSQSIQSEINEVRDFYQKLVKNYEAAIKKAMAKSQNQINKLTQLQASFLNQYQEIAQTSQLKQLLILQQQNQNSDSNLRSFLDQKTKEATQNADLITEQIQQLQYFRDSFSLEQPESNANNILQQINEISFFNTSSMMNSSVKIFEEANQPQCKSIINEISIVPSNEIVGSTNNITITNIKNNQKQIYYAGLCGQSCFDTKFDPEKRYVITLKNTVGNTNKPYPRFYFGIMPYSRRHDKLVDDYDLCYRECISAKGINKMIKGGKLHLGENYQMDPLNYWRMKDHRRFEIRIHLKEKVVKVGALPNYDLVAELSDKYLIDLKEEYTFAINNIGLKNSIIIEDVMEVQSFDELM